MKDIHQNKIELHKKHLDKQMVQSLQVLRNVYILNMTCHHIPNKHILVLSCAKHHTSVFSYDNGC